MSRIPEETLQQILASTDIVDLVGRFVKLRRAGVNWLGLCPFHQEKSPSFNVSPQRSSYHCFGCGAGGNAFRFLMDLEGLSFVEAVKRLGDAAGIRIEEEVYDAEAEKASRLRKAILKVHADIASWYHLLLMRSPAAAEARDYLKRRGTSSAIAKNWQLGYAPPQLAALLDWAKSNDYRESLLVAAGILAVGEDDRSRQGRAYPRFRHRLMFPIRNDYGEVIAFSGRVLEAETKAAKYLNSPETPIFNKSRVFFGLDKSKRAIIKANQALVCEGQMDMISAYEAGFENVVAPLGTAFTEFHARVLRRHAEEVVLCFDSDKAGFKAAERAFQILTPTGLFVKVAPLPQGEDPDSVIRHQGKEAFEQLLKGAKDFFDHALDHARETRPLHEVRERNRFFQEMLPMLALVENTHYRDEGIRKMAGRLNLPEADIRLEFQRYVKQSQKRAAGPTDEAQGGNQNSTNASAQSTREFLLRQEKSSLLLCRLALSDPEILGWLRCTGRESILQDLPNCDFLGLIWESTLDLTQPAGLGVFFSQLSKEEGSAFSRFLSEPMPKGGIDAAKSALETLEIKRLDNIKQNITNQLKDPRLSSHEIEKLQRQFLSVSKEYLDRRTQLPKTPMLPMP